jgi:hypothetical protein
MQTKSSELDNVAFDRPIVVQFPGRKSREFRTVAEVADFVRTEKSAWDFLPPEHNPAKNRFNGLEEVLRRTSEPSFGPEKLGNIARDLQQSLEQFAAAMPLHGSVQFQFVKRAHQKHGITRGIDQLFPTTMVIRDNPFERNEGIGFCLRMMSVDKAYADEFQPQVGELQQKLDEVRSLIADERKKLDDLRADYQSISDTTEPANYWKKKSEKHQAAEQLWGKAAVVAAAGWLLVLAIAYCLVHGSIVEETTAHAMANDPQLKQQRAVAERPSESAQQSSRIEVSPWYLLSRSFPLVALSVCAFWSLRIMVRNYLTNLHLKIDADERVILTQTYQTLLKGDRSLNERGFEIILGQLFRHSQSGIVKDDAAPVHPLLEYVTRSQP